MRPKLILFIAKIAVSAISCKKSNPDKTEDELEVKKKVVVQTLNPLIKNI